MVEIADFVSQETVPADIVDEFRGRVPDEIIDAWEQYGYGSFASGFLRLVDPREYGHRLEGTMGRVLGEGISIPVMVTGLADVIAWEPGLGLTAILHRTGTVRGLGSRARTFFNLIRRDPEFVEREFDPGAFWTAVESHGPLGFDESFIFAPLLGMGGAHKVENLHKRDTITAIQLMVELQGVVEH